jgi:hypothetical protein
LGLPHGLTKSLVAMLEVTLTFITLKPRVE